ncbi:molybdopterin-dependent oxidoreductase alpha subunit [Sphingomonas endophytica]|uniref:Molybdopterin-dependent oxidoreductase alpha subunit n=1 Tax=Sphingomonas endophytica TaxID=869719 RepID=A0A7X0JG14_9SPHN|nr:FdhF/YdeP family oxidoreductase [Sphingomonas endophytica]MBB6506022.1 molybdopterin-dependent oxidoreductase alpha subunit [Sphingomonas endophytica]
MTEQHDDRPDFTPYDGPSGGWGSVRSLADIIPREKNVAQTTAELLRQNKHDGFACVSCAWSKPYPPHPAEFCENGAKATAWEITSQRVTPDFFRQHTLTELRGWSDYRLEEAGRLTHPMKYDATSDKYVVAPWEEAFKAIGARLKALPPKSVVFYASGRASLETSFMWQLMARLYGNQNLPDSSNMCHESTSVGLKTSIGVPVGTTKLEDFDTTDCILHFGQNVATNSPRMLHQLRDVHKRGADIIVFNPLKERGLERFTDPQNPIEMATGKETPIATQYHQVKAGGDIAVMMGIAKWLLANDAIDHDFIAEHTHDFAPFAAKVQATGWDEIERESGLTRAAIERAAAAYGRAKTAMAIYGMGLTQHVKGVDNVRMLVNLMLMRGNIGKPGAGLCPVRGHSNVQGQRTVGITEKTELAPVEKLKERYGFSPPTEKGLDTVEACRGIIDGTVKAFLSLGGNFARAVPETELVEDGWARMDLSVQIATKLNRSHLIPAAGDTWLLPCLGRIERDLQATGPQRVTVEDSTSVIHPSLGKVEPASPHLLSEPAIVAGIAQSFLPPNPAIDWDAWVGDYSLIRDEIAAVFPHFFARFNERLQEKGGFWKGNKASGREWDTESGKAEFLVPDTLNATGFTEAEGRFRLLTLRSNDQFNTTIYGYSDRFRGINGTRQVVLMNRADIARAGLTAGQKVTLATDAEDNHDRRVGDLIVVEYDVPDGCIAAYYPECNPLIPLSHHAEESHVPAAKSVPVKIVI